MISSEDRTNKAPRLLALVTDAFGGYGGIAQYNRDFVSALAGSDSRLRLDVLPRLAPGIPEPMPAGVRQGPAISNRLKYAACALKFAGQHRPTTVFNGHLYHGPLAHRISRWTGANLVSQVHGTEIWGPLARKHRRPLEASDLILAVSRDTRAKVLSRIDIAPEKVVVLNNTVAADFTPGDRNVARARFGLTNEFVVLTVARLDAREGYKGHDRVIPLLAGACSGERTVVYLVAGIGDDESRLRQMAMHCGVEDKVRFLGKVPRTDLPDLYRAADLFALPSKGEGFGISFLEAMGCGTPAIGLAVGGAPDALGGGQLGICVSEADFAETFGKALSTPQRPDGLAAAVHARFGFDSFQTQCSRVVKLACGRPTTSIWKRHRHDPEARL